MSSTTAERIRLVRAVIAAIAGAALVIYGAVVDRADHLAIILLGLVLLGLVAFELPFNRARGDSGV